MSEGANRNSARGQAPWAFRRRVIIGTLASCGALFTAALLMGETAAFAPLVSVVLIVVPVAIGAAVVDDHSARVTHRGDAE
uniref:Uncharacterized protein n=1 Tax=Pseudo-nitzschia multiseries DNA virus TaxID=2364897 RepID=A0A678W4T5_9VIRU|nr:hypothetical protein PmDNAV1_gp27 [Pseudo-nitzschia multiseries DNA virus]